MKIIPKVAVVIASAAIALSGCSSDNSESKNTSQITKSAEPTSEPSGKSSSKIEKDKTSGESSPEAAATKFFKEFHKNSSTMNESALTMSGPDGDLAAVIGADNAEAVFNSENPVPVVDGFSPELQKKTVETFKSLIPESAPVSYGDLSDSQIVLTAAALMAMGGSMSQLGPDEEPVKPITSDNVEYSSDNNAKISYTQTGSDPNASVENYLDVVKTENGWFVDATYFYEMVSKNL